MLKNSYKICTGEKNPLCSNFLNKVEISDDNVQCPICESILLTVDNKNKKNMILIAIAILLLVFSGSFILYKTIFPKQTIKVEQLETAKVELTSLLKSYSGTFKSDTLKYDVIFLQIKNIVTADQKNVTFDYDFNVHGYREKGNGKLYPELKRIEFYSNKLQYSFSGVYDYNGKGQIIIKDEKDKWNLTEKK